jgi:G6PDH family F420-dependent oxidoreductase
MLSEAVDIIGALFGSNGNGDGTVNYRGDYYDIESAKLWDLPEQPVPIGIAVSGPDSCELAGRKGDLMIAVEPRAELGEMFDRAGGSGKSRVGQVAIAYDTDKDAAIKRAHEQFRWFGLGWKVNADLPNPDSFESATQFVTPEQVSDALSCGPDVDEHTQAVKTFIDAGFDEVALVQIGADQQDAFTTWAEQELLPALRLL